MHRSSFSKRNIMLALIPALIAIVCILPAHVLTKKPISCPVPERDSKVRIAWRIKTNDVSYLAFAPGGRYFCTFSRNNELHVYNISGTQCYSAKIPGADRAVLSPDGSYALAFSYLDASAPRIVLLDSTGKICWTTIISGAVWSADSCSADGGSRFVVGTGKRIVYVFDVHGETRHYHWWRTLGAVVSLSIAPDRKTVLYGTWQDSVLARADFDGNKLWERKLAQASLHYVEQLSSPNRLMLRSMPNSHGANGEFCLMDSDGVMIWKGIIDVSAGTHVISSPDGRYLCLGYSKVIEHGGKSVSEKHAILFDEMGERLWEKGSMFFQAEPKLVTSNGEALLSDSTGALFIMRRSGAMEGFGKMPRPIVKTLTSRDGSSLLVLCADQSLSMIEVSQ